MVSGNKERGGWDFTDKDLINSHTTSVPLGNGDYEIIFKEFFVPVRECIGTTLIVLVL